MNCQRLKNFVVLVTAVAYFAATFPGQPMKLRILSERLLIISQRFFGIPPFRSYALGDGIRKTLSQSSLSRPEAQPTTGADARLGGLRILGKVLQSEPLTARTAVQARAARERGSPTTDPEFPVFSGQPAGQLTYPS